MATTDIPAQYRSISPYIKIAKDFEGHDVVLFYWILNYAVEKALSVGSPATPEAKTYLMSLLDGLEKIKNQHPGDESYQVGAVAQCHVEAKAIRLFSSADEKDRQGVFDRNVIKSFYTSGLLFDVLSLFTKEELEEKLQEARKYAKWKATDLNNCLKNGITPQAGPPTKEGGEDDALTRELLDLNVNKPQPTPRSSSNVPSTPANQFNPTNPTNFQHPPASQNQFPNQAQGGFGWQQPGSGPPQQHFGGGHPQQQFGGGHPQQQFGGGPPQQQFGGGPPQQQFGGPPQQQFHHNVVPQPNNDFQQPAIPQSGGGALTLDDFIEARKFTKMATSALDYEDAKTGIDFLRKALKILEK